jgi:hypothetical protein
MNEDARQKGQRRPAPLTQEQVDALTHKAANRGEVDKLIELHSEAAPAPPEKAYAAGAAKRRPEAVTPEEARKLADRTGAQKSDSGTRGRRPDQKPGS